MFAKRGGKDGFIMKQLFKKLTAALAAAVMVMAMGVTAFASGNSG